MALAYTSYAADSNGGTGTGGDITTTSRTYTAGELVTAYFSVDSDEDPNNLTISNSATAQTWVPLFVSPPAGSVHGRLAAWYCVMSTTQAMTISLAGSGSSNAQSWAVVVVETGQHTTDPVPTGNIFSGTGGTDVSQSITPTASGSNLWFFAQSFTNSVAWTAITNCTIERTTQDVEGTYVLVRPTTQPRPDAAAFTIGETDTADNNVIWVAYEVQTAPAPPPPTGSLGDFDPLMRVQAWF